MSINWVFGPESLEGTGVANLKSINPVQVIHLKARRYYIQDRKDRGTGKGHAVRHSLFFWPNFFRIKKGF